MDKNTGNPMKIEFLFQIGIVVCIALSVFFSEIKELFWSGACVCAVGWIKKVDKQQKAERAQKELEQQQAEPEEEFKFDPEEVGYDPNEEE
ncbi:hypothetical protein [Chakrabartyella piscis]|uniref:hypothetical protein n=1 Tax=Chakrabartyella piscis TaxID=2918914 RepID=UPI0029589A1F|nr:hypothetical protein [Chakrabartyella piscis]